DGASAREDAGIGAGAGGTAGAGAGVTVRLFGGLDVRARRDSVVQADLSAGGVGDLIAGLGLPAAAVGLILVNGLHATPSSSLEAGDEVSLFPPIGGG
ncbi:MAG TPA: MoaD/ThiS family protein, partial [Thermoleophilia bacterium]|nr:MoaD/ThiS family protein [Thermoleophilia bacterium]